MQSKIHESSCASVIRARFAAVLAIVLVAGVCMSIVPAHAQTVLKGFTAGVPSSPMMIVKDGGDFDGDKIPDFVTVGTSRVFGLGVRAHSGATGKALWDYELGGAFVPASIAIGDVNEDGVADIILSLSRWLIVGSESHGDVIALSGKTGRLIFDFTADPNESSLGSQLEVIDLYDSGHNAFLVVSREKNGERAESKITLYDYVEGQLFFECTYRTGLVEEITDIHVVPDFDGDGARDVVFGMPDVTNGALQQAGAIFLMSTDGCSVVETIKGPLAGGRLGSYFSTIPDWNGDGVEDIGFGWSKSLSLHSGKDFSSLNKVIVPPTNIPLSRPLVALSDMTGDGITDFGTVVVDPAQNQYRRAVFFSGHDSSVVGNFSLQPFSPKEDRSIVSRDFAGLLSDHMTDVNGDGVKDPTFFVRAYFPINNNPLDDRSSRAEITTITATCPRDVKIQFLNTPEGAIIEAGTRPVFAKAVACGLDLPGRLLLSVGGVTYEMYDSGTNGDEVAGDRTYTARARLLPGQNTLRIRADVTNSVPLVAEESAQVTAVYNYDIVKKNTFEWIEPVGHEKVKLDSWYGGDLTMPFAFSFYGRRFTEMFVSNRGILLPAYSTNIDKGTAPYELEINKRLPTLEMSDPAIAVAWGFTALYDKSALYTKTFGSAGDQIFVMTFEGVEFQQESSKKSRLDYQIIFHEATGRISVNYKLVYSSERVDDQGLSLTMGLQAGPHLGVTFSHKNAVVKDSISIDYIPSQGGEDGGGDNGGGGNNGGGDGGGIGGGGNNGGGNNGGGGNDDGGGDGDDGTGGAIGGGDDHLNHSYALSFAFSQRRTGTTLAFDIRSNSPAEQQALTDCWFSVLGGEGVSATSARYRVLGTRSLGQGSGKIRLSRFWQPLVTSKPARKNRKSLSVFLRANATCSAGRVNLVSAPVRVKTSKRVGALAAKRWLTRLASQLR